MLTVGASHRTTPIAALGAMSAAAPDLERRLGTSPGRTLLAAASELFGLSAGTARPARKSAG